MREIRGQYKRTVLGQLWSLANPLAAMLIYTFIFSFLFRLPLEVGSPSGLKSYALWLLTGLLPWMFFSRVMNMGTGVLVINAPLIQKVYFPRAISRMIMRQPLELVEADEKFDLLINVTGGGLAAQADAIKHGISRALCEVDGEHRKPLKKAGFLTRDAREVERKKYGQPGARKRFQYSKR